MANRLREIRNRRGLTLQQVADKLGVHSSTISRWEEQKRGVSQRRMVDLADLYGVSVPFLFRLEGDNGNGDANDGERRSA